MAEIDWVSLSVQLRAFGHLEEIYGVDVSPSLISNVTDAVLDEVRAWQSRPLDAVYPILYLDALEVKVRSQGSVRNKAQSTVMVKKNKRQNSLCSFDF